MTLGIQGLTVPVPPVFDCSFISEVQQKTAQVFCKLKELLFPGQEVLPARPVIDLSAIGRNPGNLIEGGILGIWWAAEVHLLKEGVQQLYALFTAEDSNDPRFEKIYFAVKSVLLDGIFLISSSLYIARWADRSSIVSLGQYLPLVKHLCYATSLTGYAVEFLFEAKEFGVEAMKLFNETDLFLSQQSFRRVTFLSMRLISGICLVAWAALGIASLAGVAFGPALMPLLLTTGCVIALSAGWYKRKNLIHA